MLESWVERKQGVAIVEKVVEGERAPVVLGLRRLHPSRRAQPLDGWDTMRLLACFGVSNLLDVPWAEDDTLHKYPLKQLWPALERRPHSASLPQRLTPSRMPSRSPFAMSVPVGVPRSYTRSTSAVAFSGV